MFTIQLVLGGARSGKSSFAENQAKEFIQTRLLKKEKVCYLATAQALDGEMSDRIIQHQNDRPDEWQLIEEPLNLAGALSDALSDADCILVDCLTLWLTNCLCAQVPGYWKHAKADLLTFLKQLKQMHQDVNKTYSIEKKLIFVSNEVGHGIVPMGELSREFVDQAGWLHQELAEIADQVEFIIAGLPLTMKTPEGK